MTYQEKIEAKRVRYIELAEKWEKLANERRNSSYTINSMIPMGQPILVGHHSEKRDRKLREKAWNDFGKSIEFDDIAKSYRRKAEKVGNTGISSEDPEALEKLMKKLSGLMYSHNLMKEINKILRKHYGRRLMFIEKEISTEQLEAAVNEMIEELGISKELATESATPSPYVPHYVGFPTYSLSNSNANIKRVKERIKQITKIQETEDQEWVVGECRVVLDTGDNRIRIFFPDKPSDSFIAELKRNGFRWSRYHKAWQCFYGLFDSRIDKAKRFAEKYNNE